MKILFVENHQVFAEIVIKEFLYKHQVVVVPRIVDAWHQICENQFDLILVDYDLDDGDQLVKQIRSQNIPIKIIAVSSRDKGNASLEQAGVDATCGKMDFCNIKKVIQGLFS